MHILNIRVDNLPKSKVLEKIRQLLLSDEFGKQLFTTNPEFILEAQKNEKFREIINNSWLSVPDGYGLRLAAKYLNLIKNINRTRYPLLVTRYFLTGAKIALWGMLKNDKKLDIIKETITGTDLVPEICKIASKIPGSKIFLLGGFGDTPRLVKEKLLNNVIPSPEGTMGSLQIEYSTFEAKNIIEKINNFAPTVLFVAVGHPRAQIWIDENLPKLPTVKLALGVGGAFDYISGKIKRAPESWRSKGFEWLYRLLHQPKRLKRIWRASIFFPWKVFIKSVKKYDK